MHVFRVAFLKNEIASVKPAEGNHYFEGESYFYEHEGRLVFALIKAPSEEVARQIANELITSINRSSGKAG